MGKTKTKNASKPETSSFIKIERLAKENRWSDIAPQSLTRELLLQTDSEGNNLLHLMAQNRQISLLPTLLEKSLLDNIELLWQPLTHCNKVGTCPLNTIASNKDLDKLPRNIFGREYLKLTVPNEDSLLDICINQLNKLPWLVKELDPELLVSKEYGEYMPIHTIALYRFTHLLSPEQLTPKVVNAVDKRGNTVLHASTHFEGLHHFPKSILSEENMNKKNKDGRSPIQQIIEDEEFGDAHWGLLNGYGNNLDKFPDFLITEKNLLIKNYDDKTTLDLLLENHKEDEDSSTIHGLLSKLKSSTLKSLLKKRYPASVKKDIKKVLTLRHFLKEEKESEFTI